MNPEKGKKEAMIYPGIKCTEVRSYKISTDLQDFNGSFFSYSTVNPKNVVKYGVFETPRAERVKLLARFMINLMLIPHSNMFVERIFSQVNLIKTDTRASLEVDTVSSILKVKSYYLGSLTLRVNLKI